MAGPQDGALPAVAPVVAENPAHIKLAVSWPQTQALWFAQAECQFQVKGVAGQFDRYCHLVSA
jgi:hypothetical protein